MQWNVASLTDLVYCFNNKTTLFRIWRRKKKTFFRANIWSQKCILDCAICIVYNEQNVGFFEIQSHGWKTTVDDNVKLNWWKYAENKFKSFCIANIFWITSLEICIYILTYLLFTKRLVLAISNQYCVAYFLFFIECISICFNEDIFCLLQGYSKIIFNVDAIKL